LFSFLCSSDGCQVLRSRDGGVTQQAVLVLPPYSSPLQLRARAGRPELYLYAGGYPAPQLYRSLDGGESWQAGDLGALQSTTSIAVAPDGRLWFGAKGSVRVVDPLKLSWSSVSASPTRPLRPSARPPTPTSCAQGLADLGCPISPQQPVVMARQPFQHGRMVWIGSAPALADWEKGIVVLTGADAEGGTWVRFPDTWQEGQPEPDPAMAPPDGLHQPVRGFGKVWREQLGGSQAPIGWATAPEEGLTGTILPYQRGVVLRLGAEQLLLVDNGSWRREK
jgi:hypothetical protein